MLGEVNFSQKIKTQPKPKFGRMVNRNIEDILAT